MRKILLWATVAVIVAGGAVSCTTPYEVQPTLVEFTTIAKGYQSAVTESDSVVINDVGTWEDTWDKLTAHLINPEPAPEVDFNKYILLAHFMGQKPTSGYEVEFTEVLEGAAISATVREVSPAPECALLQVITAPYHVIQIPKTDKEVKFTVEQEIRPCPLATWYDWPMFHHDAQRSGIASGAGIITSATNFRFSFDTRSQAGGDSNGSIQASPVVANDGTIYVASASQNRGTVYALDYGGNLKTGWPFIIDAQISATPAIGPDNTIYLATYVTSSGYNFFALNPSGTIKWKLKVPVADPVNFVTLNSPVVVTEWVTKGQQIVQRPVIYISARDNGYLYKIIDDDTYGRIAWEKYLSWTSNIFLGISSPAVGPSGTIYVGILDPTVEDGGHWGKIVALNPDGSERWRISLTTTNWITNVGMYEEVASPAVAVVHYPNLFHDIPPGDYETVFAGTTDYRMKAIRENPNTHEPSIDMDFRASDDIVSCPAIYDLNGDGWVEVIFGTVSIVYPRNHVHAVSFLQGTGQAPAFCQEYWRFPTGQYVVPFSPAVALAPQPTVFIGVGDSIYSLGWERITPNGIDYYPLNVESYTFIDDWVGTSPAVAQEVTNLLGAPGWVFVGSYDSKLYAFGPAF